MFSTKKSLTNILQYTLNVEFIKWYMYKNLSLKNIKELVLSTEIMKRYTFSLT